MPSQESAIRYNEQQKLDLHLVDESGRPLVVCVHGGGFISGSRKDDRCLQAAELLIAAGFNCASIDYALAVPEDRFAQWPRNVMDVADAIAWLHERAGAYGYDFDRLGLFGFSAGCCLSNLYIQGGRRLYAHIGYPTPVFSTRALVGFYGPYDFPSRQAERRSLKTETNRDLSPSHWLRTGNHRAAPPVLHVQGDRDEIVYPAQHEMFRQDYEERGLTFVPHVVPGFGHAFAPRDCDAEGHSIDLGEEIIRFLNQCL
jgi:acetyl esterase/lipase